MSSPRRRINPNSYRNRANDRTSTKAAELGALVAALKEAVDGLTAEVLMLTRKVVSLEAELDYVRGKRDLR